MNPFQRLKVGIIGALSALAPIGVTAGVATTAAAVATSPKTVGAVTDELAVHGVKLEDRKTGILLGPGYHILHQRPLTGLEIRAVRMAGKGNANWRGNSPLMRQKVSKYVGNGIPARVMKKVRFLRANPAIAQQLATALKSAA